MELAGRICVITGAGRGLGAACARLLAAHGASLALCSRTGAGLHDLADELHRAHGVDVLTEAVDVADATAVADFAAVVGRELGPAYAVVNNAAVLGPVGPVADVDPRAWADALAVNLLGVVHVTRAFAPAMAARGGGVVVNVSGGGVGGPGVAPRLSAYTTSKAAVVALTESLAGELAGAGIRVNAIAPGALGTGFTDGVLEAGPDVAGAELYEATRRDREHPVSPEAFGALLLYVLSDEGAWLTGRLLSARWETVDDLAARRPEIERSSLYRLRRIDGTLYTERPPDE